MPEQYYYKKMQNKKVTKIVSISVIIIYVIISVAYLISYSDKLYKSYRNVKEKDIAIVEQVNKSSVSKIEKVLTATIIESEKNYLKELEYREIENEIKNIEKNKEIENRELTEEEKTKIEENKVKKEQLLEEINRIKKETEIKQQKENNENHKNNHINQKNENREDIVSIEYELTLNSKSLIENAKYIIKTKNNEILEKVKYINKQDENLKKLNEKINEEEKEINRIEYIKQDLEGLPVEEAINKIKESVKINNFKITIAENSKKTKEKNEKITEE